MAPQGKDSPSPWPSRRPLPGPPALRRQRSRLRERSEARAAKGRVRSASLVREPLQEARGGQQILVTVGLLQETVAVILRHEGPALPAARAHAPYQLL